MSRQSGGIILTDGDNQGCEGVTSHDSAVIHDVLRSNLSITAYTLVRQFNFEGLT